MAYSPASTATPTVDATTERQKADMQAVVRTFLEENQKEHLPSTGASYLSADLVARIRSTTARNDDRVRDYIRLLLVVQRPGVQFAISDVTTGYGSGSVGATLQCKHGTADVRFFLAFEPPWRINWLDISSGNTGPCSVDAADVPWAAAMMLPDTTSSDAVPVLASRLQELVPTPSPVVATPSPVVPTPTLSPRLTASPPSDAQAAGRCQLLLLRSHQQVRDFTAIVPNPPGERVFLQDSKELAAACASFSPQSSAGMSIECQRILGISEMLLRYIVTGRNNGRPAGQPLIDYVFGMPSKYVNLCPGYTVKDMEDFFSLVILTS